MIIKPTATWGQMRKVIINGFQERGVEPRMDDHVTDGVTYAEMLAMPHDQLYSDKSLPDDRLPLDVDDEDIKADEAQDEQDEAPAKPAAKKGK